QQTAEGGGPDLPRAEPDRGDQPGAYRQAPLRLEMRALQGCLAVALAVCSCSKARPREGTLAQPVSWEEDISSLFAAQCNSCHSGATPPAGYRTTSYLEALGPTSDPVAAAVDPNWRVPPVIGPPVAAHNHPATAAAASP